MIYENVFNTIQLFDDLINFDSKQCRVFTSWNKICNNFSSIKHVIDHMNAIETMTVTLRLSFSHLFWVRSLKKKIISNFIFEFIEHKTIENATKTKNISFLWIWCAKNFNVQYFLHHAFDLTHFCNVEKRLSNFIIWFISIFIICYDAWK